MNFLGVLGLLAAVEAIGAYRIGVGRADVTGPIVQVTLMGYGRFDQKGTGLHLRQWSRAFIVEDDNDRFVFATVDVGMMVDGVRIQVLKILQQKFKGKYNHDNVMLSGTHTHSGVGGYLMHTFFDLPSGGFCRESFDNLVKGIVKSIERAHENLQEGRIFLAKDTVEGLTVNRSPTSYLLNPEEERARYNSDVDTELVQLQFINQNDTLIGAFNWFPIHGTTLNYTNTLVSSDNIGYASIKLEKNMDKENLAGKSKFVGAFASSNLGDVSPNTRGPKCHQSNTNCDIYNKCEDLFEECYAIGAQDDMYHSLEYIGDELFSRAWNLMLRRKGDEVSGPVNAVHQYVDMAAAKTDIINTTTGRAKQVRGCIPAMGYSAGAGTTDGPFLPFLKQGMKATTWWLDALMYIFARPTRDDIACHSPKPILLATGHINYPFEWQPKIVSTQLARIGDMVLACVPGEFTTMAGRRLRSTLASVFGGNTTVVVAGLCNTYSDYITTYEEYQAQRYEAASTLFGPHTLSLHLAQYKKLANAIIQNKKVWRGPEPKGLDPDRMFSLIPPITPDAPHPKLKYGDVILQPKDLVVVKYGDLVKATFVSGNPRNNPRLEDTYFQIEMKNESNHWIVWATDSDVETKMHWRRTDPYIGSSEIDIEWTPWEFEPNRLYRIRHFGSYKNKRGQIRSYEGLTNTFTVNWAEPHIPTSKFSER